MSKPNTWKEIESAPKDGTFIVVIGGHAGDGLPQPEKVTIISMQPCKLSITSGGEKIEAVIDEKVGDSYRLNVLLESGDLIESDKAIMVGYPESYQAANTFISEVGS